MKKRNYIVKPILFIITILPLCFLFISSLHINNIFIFDFSQYISLFNDTEYWLRYSNSLKLTIPSIFVSMVIGLICGMFIQTSKKHIKYITITVLVLIMLMPSQVVMLPLYNIFLQIGLYDTHIAIIIMFAFSPLSTLVCYIVLEDINKEQIDAALLETSSLWVIFFDILFPEIKSGLLALFLLLWSEAWGQVDRPLFFLRSTELKPLSLYYNDIVSNPAEKAGAVIYCLPILLLSIIIAKRAKTNQNYIS